MEQFSYYYFRDMEYGGDYFDLNDPDVIAEIEEDRKRHCNFISYGLYKKDNHVIFDDDFDITFHDAYAIYRDIEKGIIILIQSSVYSEEMIITANTAEQFYMWAEGYCANDAWLQIFLDICNGCRNGLYIVSLSEALGSDFYGFDMNEIGIDINTSDEEIIKRYVL